MYYKFAAGFMAGTGHTAVGGGVNQQCLPVNPEYNLFSNGGSASIISGAEYETHQSGINEAAHNQNVPCARCYSTKSAVMMLPAKRTCPTGWSKEYEREDESMTRACKLEFKYYCL